MEMNDTTVLPDQVENSEASKPSTIKAANLPFAEESNDRDFEQKYAILAELLETVELRSQVGAGMQQR